MSLDQPTNDGGGEAQAQLPIKQESTFSLSPPLMGGIDPMTLNSMSMDSMTSDSGPQQPNLNLNAVAAGRSTLESLAPKFPPQNFEVPDISFSNSVSPNKDFDQSIFSSVGDMADTAPLFPHVTTTSGCMAIPQPIISSQTKVDGTFSHPMNMSNPAMMTTQSHLSTPLLQVSRSPTGTSSSDDSDDLPLAQIAMKRTTGMAVSCASSSMPSTMVTKASLLSAGPGGITDSSTSFPDPVTSPTESSPPAGSPPSSKKAKTSKRKKKKDPNEPQKPVSAYALFFRDTQATIKGHNPSASFGEVSKIVASMWDQLDPQHKDVYKKKTEAAKKLYLKQLAAYRASQVSKSAGDESDKSPSPPGIGVAQPVMAGNSTGAIQNLGMIHSGPGNAIVPPQMSASVNGPMMHLPPQIMQQQQQQFIPQQQQQQQMQMHHHQMTTQSMSPSPSSSLQQQSPSQQHMHLQTSPHQPQVPVYSSPLQGGNNNIYHQTPLADPFTLLGAPDHTLDMDVAYNRCTRRGCSNQVIENPAWDSEYCSNECVIIHCRDVFSSWSATRSGSTKFPVK